MVFINIQIFTKNKKINNTFIVFFIYQFAVALIVVFLFCFFVINNVNRKAYEEIGKSNIKSLETIRKNFESVIIERANELNIKLFYNNEMYESVFLKNPKKDMQNTAKIIKNLSKECLSDTITSIYLYNKNYNTIVSTDGCTVLNEDLSLRNEVIDLYDVYWLNYININHEDFKYNGWISSQFTSSSSFINENKNIISYLSSYNVLNRGIKYDSLIVLNFNEKKIYEGVNESKGNLNEYYIFRNNGEIFSSSDSVNSKDSINKYLSDYIKGKPEGYYSINASNAKYIITLVKSKDFDWSYVSLYYYKTNLKSVILQSKNIIIFGLFTLLVSILISLYLARKQYSPINSLAKLAKQLLQGKNTSDYDVDNTRDNENEFLIIKTAFNLMIENVNKLQSSIEKNRSVAVNNMLSLFLQANIKDDTSISKSLVNLKIDLNRNQNRIILIRVKRSLEDFDEDEFKSAFFRYFITSCRIDSFHLAFIINGDMKNVNINELCLLLKDKLLVKDIISIGVSSIKCGDINLRSQYCEAKEACNNSFILPDDKIHFFENIVTSYDLQSAKIKNFETKLSRSFISKSSREFEYTMDEIIDFIISNKLAYSIVTQILTNITIVINTIINQNTEHKEMLKGVINYSNELWQRFENLHSFKDWFIEITFKLFQEEHYYKDLLKNEIIEKVKQIVNQKVYEDIDIESISSLVFISSSYLRQIFKKEVGITLVNYIYNVKMEKACELLSTTDNKIEEIALRLGYNSSQYFIKRFKEYSGLTPNIYRIEKACSI